MTEPPAHWSRFIHCFDQQKANLLEVMATMSEDDVVALIEMFAIYRHSGDEGLHIMSSFAMMGLMSTYKTSRGDEEDGSD